MSGPCLSSSVAGRPLRPATRHSLGEPLPHQLADRPRAHQEASCDFGFGRMSPLAICGINSPFGELSPTSRQIAHVLRTRSPLEFIGIATNEFPFDLHVLSTPPAFVLSQNQTLRKRIFQTFADLIVLTLSLPRIASRSINHRLTVDLFYFTQSFPDLHRRNVGSHASHISILKEQDAPPFGGA